MRQDQVSEVRGYADQSPRDTGHPDAPTNRRVTLVIQYLISKDPVPTPDAPKETVKAGAVPAAPPAGTKQNHRLWRLNISFSGTALWPRDGRRYRVYCPYLNAPITRLYNEIIPEMNPENLDLKQTVNLPRTKFFHEGQPPTGRAQNARALVSGGPLQPDSPVQGRETGLHPA